jgi:GSH-dependent disulfide-bond oxidoreductase
MIELYHAEPNTFFLKPLIALKEKGADFKAHYFDATKFDQFAPNFPRNTESDLQLEREGPVLVDGGEIISSSFFMLEYISESVPGADINPGGELEHYRARAWGQFLGLGLGPVVYALGCAKYLTPALKKRDQNEVKGAIAKIEPVERRNAWLAVIDGSFTKDSEKAAIERAKFPVKRVEDWLSKNPWLTGSGYSIADIDAYALLSVLHDLAPEVVNATAAPRIMDFLNRMKSRESVQAALAMSKSGNPQQYFVPGAEPARWG